MNLHHLPIPREDDGLQQSMSQLEVLQPRVVRIDVEVNDLLLFGLSIPFGPCISLRSLTFILSAGL